MQMLKFPENVNDFFFDPCVSLVIDFYNVCLLKMPVREICQICIEPTPPSRKFKCPFCDFETCKTCVIKYITGSADDANCMNCKRLFDREILVKGTSQTFVNTQFKMHRERILLERETAMMPATQVYVNQELQRRANIELLRQLYVERQNLKRKMHELERSCYTLQNQIVPPLEQERRQFNHRCSQSECRGFLSSAWKCNICNKYTCSECNAPRGTEREDGHVCQESDRETMKLLKTDSRKCPGCAQFIFKVSGCDQMWCTACHTAFSWRTGLKINGNIHNPHFYEFQRNHHQGHIGREAGDIPCGGMPTSRELMRALKDGPIILPQAESQFLCNLHRVTLHIEGTEIPRYETRNMTERANLDLRIHFMLNEISAESFKEKLQQREKKMQKKRDVLMILQMFVHSMGDMYRQSIVQNSYATQISLMTALVDYVNRSLVDVSKKYNCVVPEISLSRMQVNSLKHR